MVGGGGGEWGGEWRVEGEVALFGRGEKWSLQIFPLTDTFKHRCSAQHKK